MATDTENTVSHETQDKQMSVDEAILTRHSTRLFLPKPVPDQVLNKALELATRAPSNSNTQAWRLYVVTGPALDRLKASLMKTASTSDPAVSTIPEELRHFRSALGKTIYADGWHIDREDQEGRKREVMRNYEFYGAPVAVMVCMSKTLPEVAAFSVGMYMQTLLLALTDAGVGSCMEVSIAGYPDVVRREVGLADNMRLLCGMAVGYEDESANVNKIRVGRSAVSEFTTFVKD